MNILNTVGVSGGFPLASDDLQFTKDASKEITANLTKSLIGVETAVILWGCTIEVTNSGGVSPTLIVADGAIFYVDEVYTVSAFSLALPSGTTLQNVLDNYKWDLSVTSDTPVIYKNGMTNDAYLYRRSKLVPSPTTWVDVNATIPTLKSLIVVEEATDIQLGTVYKATSADLKTGTTSTAVTSDLLGIAGEYIPVSPYNSDITLAQVNCRAKVLGQLVIMNLKCDITVVNTTNELIIQIDGFQRPLGDVASKIPVVVGLAGGISSNDYFLGTYGSTVVPGGVNKAYYVLRRYDFSNVNAGTVINLTVNGFNSYEAL